MNIQRSFKGETHKVLNGDGIPPMKVCRVVTVAHDELQPEQHLLGTARVHTSTRLLRQKS